MQEETSAFLTRHFILNEVEGKRFPQNSERPTDNEALLVNLRSCAEKMRSIFEKTNMLSRLKLVDVSDKKTIDNALEAVARRLFEESRREATFEPDLWVYVLELLVFAGALAEQSGDEQLVEDVVLWVTRYLNTQLLERIKRRGGWRSFNGWSDGFLRYDDGLFLSKAILGVLAGLFMSGTMLCVYHVLKSLR